MCIWIQNEKDGAGRDKDGAGRDLSRPAPSRPAPQGMIIFYFIFTKQHGTSLNENSSNIF